MFPVTLKTHWKHCSNPTSGILFRMVAACPSMSKMKICGLPKWSSVLGTLLRFHVARSDKYGGWSKFTINSCLKTSCTDRIMSKGTVKMPDPSIRPKFKFFPMNSLMQPCQYFHVTTLAHFLTFFTMVLWLKKSSAWLGLVTCMPLLISWRHQISECMNTISLQKHLQSFPHSLANLAQDFHVHMLLQQPINHSLLLGNKMHAPVSTVTVLLLLLYLLQ